MSVWLWIAAVLLAMAMLSALGICLYAMWAAYHFDGALTRLEAERGAALLDHRPSVAVAPRLRWVSRDDLSSVQRDHQDRLAARRNDQATEAANFRAVTALRRGRADRA